METHWAIACCGDVHVDDFGVIAASDERANTVAQAIATESGARGLPTTVKKAHEATLYIGLRPQRGIWAARGSPGNKWEVLHECCW